jgi:hypothetical protein
MRRALLPIAAVLVAVTLLAAAGSAVARSTDRVVPQAADPATTVRQAAPIPFDPFPAVTLPTTTGSVTLGGGPGTESYILLAHSGVSVFGEEMWAGKVDWLFDLSPNDAHYVFASYADTPEAVAADLAPLKAKIDAALATRTPAEQAHWAAHLHYVTVNPLTLGGAFAHLLDTWGTVVSTVRAQWQDEAGNHDITLSSTPDTGWAAPITQTVTAQLASYGGRACGAETPTQAVTGRFALIERGTCVFPEKVLNAEKHGAIGAILYDDGRGKLTMGGSCDPCPKIPVVMIDQKPGQDMRTALEAGHPVTTTLTPQKVGAEGLGQDHQGRLREFGEVPYAFNSYLVQEGQPPVDIMASFAYEAQYYNYEHRRDTRLRDEESAGKATVFPMITDQWVSDPNWAGQRAYAEVNLPGPAEMAKYDTAEIELGLGCEDNTKAKCPIWDYIDNLYLCDVDNPDHCDLEVARWITGYDTYAQWVTDISPMLAYLADGGTRRFAFYNQQRYKVNMRLRLSNRGKPVAPKRAVELAWRGGGFARDYNKYRQPIRFQVPDWATKVELVAFITGHGGNDDNGCGEFCNHTHHFQVNVAPEHVLRNDVVDASNPVGMFNGCKSRVADGVVANQGGTWVYGRAGWCPGLDVPPWSADITADVVKGDWNMIHYRGLFNGQDYVSTYQGKTDPPPPSGWDARIDMRAYIVYSAAPGVTAGPVPPALSRWLFLPATSRAGP